jgi:hypothetical protein
MNAKETNVLVRCGSVTATKNVKFRLFILQLTNPNTDSQLSLESRAGSMNGGEFLGHLISFSSRNMLRGLSDFMVQNLPSSPDS